MERGTVESRLYSGPVRVEALPLETGSTRVNQGLTIDTPGYQSGQDRWERGPLLPPVSGSSVWSGLNPTLVVRAGRTPR